MGKTETARQFAASELRLDSGDPMAVLARQQPTVALEGDTPRLLDEYQLVSGLWNEVRRAVDERRAPEQFILSGSAAPDDDDLRHSGAGRFRQLMMRTMSLFETGHSMGSVSISQLLQGGKPSVVESGIEFVNVIERIVQGGWPGWLSFDERASRAQAMSYLSDIAEHDFVQVAGTRRDPR